jgi:Cu+-exporting ATPase
MDGLTIGDVAKEAKVNIETLRYYERRGLLASPPRSTSNYRLYAEDTVRRVRFIEGAQELGFSLKEILDLLSLQAEPNSSCEDIRERAAERGILMRSGEAFQVLKDVTVIVLDKTGTLTEGKPAVVRCLAPGHEEHDVLRLAASAETLSEHPLAQAMVQEAQTRGLALAKPEEFQAYPGRGVTAAVDGRQVVVGTPRLLEERGVDLSPIRPALAEVQAQGQTAVVVAVDGRAGGVVGLADRLKPDARSTVEQLRRLGLQPVLLTGDHRRTAEAVAREVGIDHVMAEVLPGDKAEEVRRHQQQGTKVAMVGDGINDAPELMQADVGIVMGAGTDITIEAADIVLVGERLSALVEARELARRSYRLTATNVSLALGFNGIGVLAAVTGMVAPVWAMLAMAVSVSVVLANSFAGRLRPKAMRASPGERR